MVSDYDVWRERLDRRMKGRKLTNKQQAKKRYFEEFHWESGTGVDTESRKIGWRLFLEQQLEEGNITSQQLELWKGKGPW